MKFPSAPLHSKMGAALLFGISFFLIPSHSVRAVLYAPGATLDPACLPTDVGCGVQMMSGVATGTAGQIGYYATTGGVLSGTSSLVTTATSTFAGLNIASLSLRVATLNASNCDLKATTDGTFYCGSDAAGGSPTWGSITGTLSAQTDLWNVLDPKLSTTTLALFDKGFFFSTTSADYFIGTKGALPNLSTLTGLVSFGSSSATTTALGNLAIMGSATATLDFAAGGTLFVKSGGNVGVGTSSPFTALSVQGTIYGTGWNFFGTNPSGVTGATNIVLSNAPILSQPIFQSPRGGTNAFSFMAIRGTTNTNFTTGGYISFEPYNSTEVARITPFGNFGIGTISPQGKLHITNDGSLSQILLEATSSGAGQHYWGFQASSTGAFVLNSLSDVFGATNRFMVDASGKVGIGTSSPATALDVGGTITQLAQKGCSTGLTTDALGSINGCVASDERLKKNIESLTLSLDALNKLSPVTYEWNDENRDTQIHAGFIAQEVGKVFPQAVVSAGNGFKGVDPNAILALIVRAIQDLAQSITTVVLNATTGNFTHVKTDDVTTKELCIGSTCVTEDELKTLLRQPQQQSAQYTTPQSTPTSETTVASTTLSLDTSSTIEEISTESTSSTTTTDDVVATSSTETTASAPVPDSQGTTIETSTNETPDTNAASSALQ